MTIAELKEAFSEIQRERKVRESVYPGWIQNGRLSERTATKRIEILRKLEGFLEDRIKQDENPLGL